MHSRPHADYLAHEMAQAERELDARIDHALAQGREVERRTEELDRRQGPPEPPTDEEVRRIKAFVLSHARTEEWNRVIERINRGELTWREVVEALSTGRIDRGVAAAFDSLSRVPPASLNELVESGVFPAMPTDSAPADDKPADEPKTGSPRHHDDDDDDYFTNPLQRPR
jgi:hypothetical protein